MFLIRTQEIFIHFATKRIHRSSFTRTKRLSTFCCKTNPKITSNPVWRFKLPGREMMFIPHYPSERVLAMDGSEASTLHIVWVLHHVPSGDEGQGTLFHCIPIGAPICPGTTDSSDVQIVEHVLMISSTSRRCAWVKGTVHLIRQTLNGTLLRPSTRYPSHS